MNRFGTGVHARRHTALAACGGGLALVLFTSCRTTTPVARPSATSPTRGETRNAPREHAIAIASDPAPDTGPCGGYVFDGVAIGTSFEDLEKSIAVVAVPPAESLIEGFQSNTYAFQARRTGRMDDVQLGIGGKTSRVEFIQASILVGPEDVWPRTLFKALGSPKHVRHDAWIWYNMACGLTLRLTRIETLGAGDAHAYSLEVRRTLKPVTE